MSGGLVTINSRKFDQGIRRTWTCRLVERNEPLLVLEGEFEDDVEHVSLGLITRGTISREYFWLDRWYNVFRFHEPGGELQSYYCNISMPPVFNGKTIDYVDLDIDVVAWKDGKWKVLDLDDFEVNSHQFGYPADIVTRSHAALDDLVRMITHHAFPFDF